jgi:hypothetical protein
MQVNPALLGIVARYTAALLAREDVSASTTAIGLVVAAAELSKADEADRQALISALRATANDLESARWTIH